MTIQDAPSEDSNWTALMCRLIRILAGHTSEGTFSDIAAPMLYCLLWRWLWRWQSTVQKLQKCTLQFTCLQQLPPLQVLVLCLQKVSSHYCILNRLSHTIYWKSPTSILGTSGFEIYLFLEKMAKLFANSGDTDQMLCSAVSNLHLHCLPVTLLCVFWLQWVNKS